MKSVYLKVDDEIKLYRSELEFAPQVFAQVDKNRTYLKKWLSWVDKMECVENSRTFLKEGRSLTVGGQQLITWIFYQGELCGNMSFVRIDPKSQSAEIGYWLSEDKTGKGIATRACKRLIRYGFEKLNFNRIVIQVEKENIPSQKIPQRLGFTQEGIARQALYRNESFHDLFVFSLLKEEWEN